MPRRTTVVPERSRSIQVHDALRVGIFNVKYSSNLGDGLLSECLEAELTRCLPGLKLQSFDLAGRRAYHPGLPFRGALLNLLQLSPSPIRQILVQSMLGLSVRRLIPIWRKQLEGVDVAVTGGGNLFSDADLNFPTKIHAAWSVLRELGIPVAVFAVGVSDNWTRRGESLFQRAVAKTNIFDASVRDARSAELWDRQIGLLGMRTAKVVHDPGLLVSLHVPRASLIETDMPRVGINITHPTTLRYHADEQIISGSDLTAWYVELVCACAAKGWHVTIFTNGSSEDVSFSRFLRPIVSSAAASIGCQTNVTFADRFPKPSDLATCISGFDLMLGHRLHANIVAFSYGIPHIGFTWDAKLKSFFDLTDRRDFLCTAGRDRPATVVNLAQRCLQEGINCSRHRRILDASRADVVSLAEKMVSVVRQRRSSVGR